MAETSSIEWTDATWTPIRARFVEIQNDSSGKERIGWHCEHVSEGCRNCYAERMNRRLGTGVDFKPGELFREQHKGYRNGEVKLFLDDNMLTAPLRWKKPRMIFVCSMTDLFADFVPDAWIDRVFAVMALSPQHTFQVLTKRSKRMRDYLTDPLAPTRIYDIVMDMVIVDQVAAILTTRETHAIAPAGKKVMLGQWPLPNVWLGVSAERQQEADERIPDLLAADAATRFVSLEPLIGPIDLTCVPRPAGWPVPVDDLSDGIHALRYLGNGAATGGASFALSQPTSAPAAPRLAWVIVGGESGPDARPMHPDWARSLRDQCAAAGTPFFFKQWGGWAPLDQRPASNEADRQGLSAWMILDRHGDLDIPDHRWPDEEAGEVAVIDAGKKRAGRLLDRVEHNAMPEGRR